MRPFCFRHGLDLRTFPDAGNLPLTTGKASRGPLLTRSRRIAAIVPSFVKQSSAFSASVAA